MFAKASFFGIWNSPPGLRWLQRQQGEGLGEGWTPQLSIIFTQGTQLLYVHPVVNYFSAQKMGLAQAA